MNNIIQIKHGRQKPGNGTLAPYELGYAENGGLFIGDENGNTVPVSTQVENGENGGKFVYHKDDKFQASNLLIIPPENFGSSLPGSGKEGQVFFVI